ncbi:hypothetical protein PFNF135_01540, partial [Plasmodium falciparum NF135/5.C10]
EKYKSEIKKYTNGQSRGTGGSKRKKRSAHGGSNDNGYEKNFYEKLKEKNKYVKVDGFLELLNKEDVCTKKLNDQDEEEGKIDFKNVKSSSASGDGSNKTFYRTTYCEACPWCGAQKKSGGGWEAKNEDCANEVTKEYNEQDTTTIEILTPEEGQSDILKKYNKFCKNGANGEKSVIDGGQIKKWQCYYDKDKPSGQNNNCVQGEWKDFKKGQKVTSYNAFFWDWVHDMLHDSIEWRDEHGKCINKDNGNTCISGCKKKCDCFQKWVQQKESEWENVKKHFKKQKDIVKEETLLGGVMTHDFVLEGVLKDGNLLQNIKDVHGDTDDIKHIEELLKDEEATGAIAGGENNTTIDKLLKHEEQDAKQCLEKQEECEKKKQQPKPSPARSAEPLEDITHHDSSHEDDEEDSEASDNEEDEDEVEEEEEAPEGDTTKETTTPQVKPCDIVKDLFENPKTDFKDACTLKYGPKAPTSWKCISDTTTTSGAPGKSGDTAGSGSICIPPRRRRLYVGKLEEWAEKQVGNTQVAEPQGETSSPSGEKLREAFIESAAVETFFLWHEYKKEWESRHATPEVGAGLGLNTDNDDPQNKLKSGNIPIDFLRLMFYTLGDYRDILFSGSNNNNIVLEASNDKEKMKQLQTKIKEHINSGSTPAPKPNGTTPKDWWKKYGPDIWEGMICALTYKESDAITGDVTKITQDSGLKNALWDDNTKKPKKEEYQYNSVTLKEDESGTGPRTTGASIKTEPTKLTDFVKRPPYFRYLEEWGQNFCKERKKRLKEVKKGCRKNSSDNDTFCSGDGHDCTDGERRYNNMFADLFCRPCYEQCRKYRKWIDLKFDEYHKQENKYEEEKQKLNGNSNGNNNCCKEIQNLPSAAEFLKALKHCKNGQNNSEEKGTEEDEKNNKINFDKPENTFNPSTYCKACPIYGVNCDARGRSRGRSATNGCTTNNEPENKENTADGQPTTIPILINDGATDGSTDVTDKQLEEKCKKYGLYKDLRKQVWKCQHINNIYKCELQKQVTSEYYDHKIPFNILLQRWINDFIQYYNKSKARITRCINDVTLCKQGCKGNCECVQNWLNKKEEEWNIIKEYYNQNFHSADERIDSRIKSFFEQGTFFSDAKKAQEVVENPDDINKIWGCTGRDDCTTEETKPDKDFIINLINKLNDKIQFCQTQHGKAQAECDLPPLDDPEPPEEDPDTSTTSVVPHICEQFVAPEPQPPAPPAQDRTSEDASTEEKEEVPFTPSLPPEDLPPEKNVPVPPPKKPSTPRRRPREVTHSILPEMVSISAFPLSVGIAFAALSYFLLKKKSKSTIDLLRVIDIPKGEYGIPTSKSKNRYIPYASDRYKGKTYIYMEGDSDSGHYYEDTTDITSSESEYEEFDINDIYVPGSSKYKTLIEVVLEPSKRDTMNTQNDIPLNDKLDSNKLTDEEWNQLKQDFISNISQNSQMDLPQNNISRDTSINIHPDVSILHDSMQEKPFITSIHDRDLHNGEEVTYNINLDDHKNMHFSTNHDNISPKNNKNDLYSGIDLINDSISGNHNVEIYDELLKRKENELFGTNNTKHTTTNIVAKQTHNDPIVNQINLFHKWLDRHRNMCEQWDKNKKEELLDKLNEEWNKENKNNSNVTDTNGENNITRVLNSDVSIQIDMNSKPI